MSRVSEVLNEVRPRRLTEARIDELKKPWHVPFWPLLTELPWIVVFAWSTGAGFSVRSWVGIGCMIAFGALSIGIVVAIRTRDRMWRQVIEREAPSLHGMLSRKLPSKKSHF
jgi:protein-S-isoprenylcysteine O-methyltransferase Ste14